MNAQPPVPDPAAVDEVLRMFPAPVAVIGVRAGEELGGLTAAWVMRVSMDPALVMVSIGHQRRTWDLFQGASRFTISLLAEGQVEEARLFGLHSRRDRDKWAETDHVPMGDGVPACARCSARLLLAVTDSFRTGDHDCFVGQVVQAEVVDGLPALPMRGSDYAPRAD